MKKQCFISIIFLFSLLFSTPKSLAAQNVSEKVDSIYKQLTLDEKIGQLFMVYAETDWSGKNKSFFFNQLKKYQPGGIIAFGGTPGIAKNFIKQAQAKAKVPFWVGIDAEYGLGMRMKSEEPLPYAMQLGALQDNRLVEQLAYKIGLDCKNVGAHFSFSPVLDLNTNPENPVINYRSFGDKASNVINKASAYCNGLNKAGIVAVGKHFPGHGNTSIDSHIALPKISGSPEDIYQTEIAPFKEMIHRGLPSVMMGHLVVAALDSTKQPASLSKPIIQTILKDSLKFDGLIFSDAMNMHAVAKGIEKPFVKAFLAGNDMLLLPKSIASAHQEIKTAIQNNEISKTELEDRCKRILTFKHQLTPDLFKTNKRSEQTGEPISDQLLVKKIREQAITLIHNPNRGLPINNSGKQGVVLIENTVKESPLCKRIRFYAKITRYNIKDLKDSLIQKQLSHSQNIVFAAHGNLTQKKDNYGIDSTFIKTYEKFASSTKTALVALSNPYGLIPFNKELLKQSSVLVTYDDSKITQQAVGEILFGGRACTGKLSVSIPNFAEAGTGLTLHPTRLGFALPEEVNLMPSVHDSIAKHVNEAIAMKATPGAQVVVVKNNKIVLRESYGYHTYSKKRKVKNSDLYDLASVTKISAAIPTLMQLYDQGKIRPNDRVSTYLERLKGTDKNGMTIRQLIRHTSGLPSYIPFQYRLLDEKTLNGKDMFSRRKTSTYSIKLDNYAYLNKNAAFYTGFFSRHKDIIHPNEVVDNMYAHFSFQDTLQRRLDDCELNNVNRYNYSDLGYQYLYQIFTSNFGIHLAEHLQQSLYQPLGMYRTSYLPRHKFDKNEIAPTEKDPFFRKKLIHGYVHDPAAALMGGVSCHAGLFSTASDMAKLMQLYLNLGSYGDSNYFESSTLKLFTTDTKGDERRALGFDKPEPNPRKINPCCDAASLSSFGHTGFTGTYVWADPEEDLIFIFLSNRIHPYAYNRLLAKENIRTNAHQSVYNCILKAH